MMTPEGSLRMNGRLLCLQPVLYLQEGEVIPP